MTGQDMHDVIEERLLRVEQRYTNGRRRIIEVLEQAGAPVTLPQLLASESAMPQSSAYRNLAVLEQVGVVTKIVTTGEFASFELAEDLTGHHHHHLVCTSCGDVSDYSLTAAVERQLDKVLTQAAHAADYHLEGHRLDLVGQCGRCR